MDAADVVDFGGDETPGFIDEEEAMAERCGGERDSREEWWVVRRARLEERGGRALHPCSVGVEEDAGLASEEEEE